MKLDIQYIPIDKIKPYDKNPRINDNAVEYVANSIKEFGFKVPIVIDKNNTIIAGHTRYKAMLQIGAKELPCIIADDLDEAKVKAFRLADNKVSDYSLWDNKLLIEELEELTDIDDEVFTGFDLGEIFDVFDEASSAIDNTDGFIYELVLKSEDKEKLQKIQEIWEDMDE